MHVLKRSRSADNFYDNSLMQELAGTIGFDRKLLLKITLEKILLANHAFLLTFPNLVKLR